MEYVKYTPTLTDYVTFILMLSVVFGLGFQSPIAIVFSERMGLVTVDTLRNIRKYVLLAVFVIAAVATPPDVITQVSLAVPLYILYESSILFCHFWNKRKPDSE